MRKNKSVFLILLLPFFISLSCVKSRLAPELIENVSTDKKEIEVREGETSTFTITSFSKRELNFTISQLYSALDINPKSGVIKNNKQTFNVTIDKNAHLNGFFNLPITIKTEIGDIIINTRVYAGDKYFLQFPDSIIVDMNTNSNFFSVLNNSLKFIPFEIEGDSILKITPIKDSIAPSQTKNIPFTVNRLGLTNGAYFGKISLKSGINQYSIYYRIEHFLERKIPLAVSNIIDADYCRSNDRLVLASQDPNQLLVFDLNKQLVKKIDLPGYPNCVSISPDGKYAAVGGFDQISYLDLTTNSIIKSIYVGNYISDIVVSNSYTICFVDTALRSFNLVGNNFSPVTFPNAQALPTIKMHPSKKYLYAQVNDLNGAKYHKIDIQTSVPYYLYETSFNGAYTHINNYWFSDNGNAIFTDDKNSLICSDNKDIDLSISTPIIDGFLGNFRCLDVFGNRNLLYILSEGNSSLLGVFDPNSMTYTKNFIQLEKYMTNVNGYTQFVDSDGKFVFVNSTGNKTLVVSKIKANFIPNRWGIEIIDN